MLIERQGQAELIQQMDQGDCTGATYPQLVEIRHYPRQHNGIVERVVLPSNFDVELLGEILELDAAIDHGACKRQSIVENQLLEPLEVTAGAPQHRNIEFLPIVGDDEIGSHELAEALPHFRHRRRANQVPIGVAMYLRGLRRDAARARHQGMELTHYDIVPNPDSGNIDDLG